MRCALQLRKQVVDLTAAVRELCSSVPTMPGDIEVESADEESDEEVSDATTPLNIATLDASHVHATLLGEEGLAEKLALLVSLCSQFDKIRFPDVGGPESAATAPTPSGAAHYTAVFDDLPSVAMPGPLRSLASAQGGGAGGAGGAGAGRGGASAWDQRVALVSQCVQCDLFRLRPEVSSTWPLHGVAWVSVAPTCVSRCV